MSSTPLKFKFSRRDPKPSALFLLALAAAVSFGFSLGAANVASAAACSSDTSWHGTNFSCDVTYQDAGGSNLTTCQYKLLNAPGGYDTGWLPVPAASCSGLSQTLTWSITVGAGQNCRDQGTGACELSANASDSSGNIIQPFPTVIKTFNIDYTPPSGGSISYTNGFSTSTAAQLTVNDGSDSVSGINTSTRIIQRKSATLSGGACGTFGSFAAISPLGGYPNFIDFGLTSGNCYQYQYLVSDNAGNQATYANSNTVKVDTIAPTISTFTVSPVPPSWVNYQNPNVAISWAASDTGGSGTDHYELWRAPDSNGSPGTWGVVSGKDNLSSSAISTTDAPGSGVWWYGLHAVDAAGNCIAESGGHCGGVTSDSLDTRTAKGPTKIQADTSPPTAQVTNPAVSSLQFRPSFNVTLSFQDLGGSGLLSYQYSVYDSGRGVTALAWTTPGSNDCSTSGGVTTCTEKITVGTGNAYCQSGGTNMCVVDVRATDGAGNAGIGSRAFSISLNQAPSLSSLQLTPTSPFKAGVLLTFQGAWSDPEGDSSQLFVCKTNSTPSGGNCSGGDTNKWCSTSLSTTSPASCTYTTQSSDQGTQNYYGFICDNGNACSSSQSGIFLVDATAPGVSSFLASPVPPNWVNIANPNAIISWTVGDAGGSYLGVVNVWKSTYNSSTCNGTTNVSGCSWSQVGSDVAAPVNSTSWSCGNTGSCITDTPADGTYLYGMHVTDKAGNCTREDGASCGSTSVSLSLRRVQVDKTAPPLPACTPAGGTFLNSVSVTCTDNEGGVTIRYTEDGTAPITSSTQYTGAFNITNSETLIVAAWDSAGNRSQTPDHSYSFTITHNTPPQAVSLQDDHATANYCSTTSSPISPPITLSWQYQDPDAGAYESAHQVQISTDNFSTILTILLDTGKVSDPANTIHNGDRKSYAPPAGTFSYNTTYYWRVKVWDDQDAPSSFASGAAFSTPAHYYPIPDFTWSPASPSANEQVQFTDQTNFSPSATSKSWSWNFGDNSSSNQQNPKNKYKQNGSYAVLLTASDNAGSCSKSKTVNIGIPFPQWQEISPF